MLEIGSHAFLGTCALICTACSCYHLLWFNVVCQYVTVEAWIPCIPVAELPLTRHCIVVNVSDKNSIINCQSLPLNLSPTPL